MWKIQKRKLLKVKNVFSAFTIYFLLRIWHFSQLYQFHYGTAVLWIFPNFFYAICFMLATTDETRLLLSLIAFSRKIGSQERSIVRATGFAVSGDRIVWSVERNSNACSAGSGSGICNVAETIGSDIGSEWKCRQRIWPYLYAHCAHMRSRESLLRNRQPNRSDHTGRSACRWSLYSHFYFRDPTINIPPVHQYRELRKQR